MKIRLSPNGSTRTRTRFLWYPRCGTISGTRIEEWRWLCFATYTEEKLGGWWYLMKWEGL